MRGCITLIFFVAAWMIAMTTMGLWFVALLVMAIVWAIVYTIGYTFEKTGKALKDDSTVSERPEEVERQDHVGS